MSLAFLIPKRKSLRINKFKLINKIRNSKKEMKMMKNNKMKPQRIKYRIKKKTHAILYLYSIRIR